MQRNTHPIYRTSVVISLDGRSNYYQTPTNLLFYLQPYDYRIRSEKIVNTKYILIDRDNEDKIDFLLIKKPYLNFLLNDYAE